MTIQQDDSYTQARAQSPLEFVKVDNERFERRRPCNLSALIHGGEDARGGACRVLDMSASGAQIVLTSESFGRKRAKLNEPFWLHFPHDGSQVRCKIVWEEGKACGVRFISPMQVAPRRRKAREQPSSKGRSLFGLLRI